MSLSRCGGLSVCSVSVLMSAGNSLISQAPDDFADRTDGAKISSTKVRTQGRTEKNFMKTAARGSKPQIREVKRKGQRDLSDPAGSLHPQGNAGLEQHRS